MKKFKERIQYRAEILQKSSMDSDPFKEFLKWLEKAEKIIEEPNAVFLSTTGKDQKPSSRIVLIKEIKKEGFIFYTNYNSRKAIAIKENPIVYLTFFWPQLRQQIHIQAYVKKVDRIISENYFQTRPYESQIAAHISNQSSIIEKREDLDLKIQSFKEKYQGKPIPCPQFWGGFCAIPYTFEFWQGQENRLHDRIYYEKQKNVWRKSRLSP